MRTGFRILLGPALRQKLLWYWHRLVVIGGLNGVADGSGLLDLIRDRAVALHDLSVVPREQARKQSGAELSPAANA